MWNSRPRYLLSDHLATQCARTIRRVSQYRLPLLSSFFTSLHIITRTGCSTCTIVHGHLKGLHLCKEEADPARAGLGAGALIRRVGQPPETHRVADLSWG